MVVSMADTNQTAGEGVSALVSGGAFAFLGISALAANARYHEFLSDEHYTF